MTQALDDRRVHAALWLSVFVTAFNVMTLVTLLPTIVRDLGTTIGTGQTALVLLALVTAAASSAEEHLSELYGRRSVYRVGLVLFAAGLRAAAVGATSLALLAGISVIAGLGAAVLVTAPFVVVATAGDDPQPVRGRRTGYLMLALTTGALVGPVIAGVISTAVGWRWAFVPQLIIVLLLAWLTSALPAAERRGEKEVDWVGTIVALLAITCVVVGLGLAGEYGWWSPKKPFLVGGVEVPPFRLSIAPLLIVIGVVTIVGTGAWGYRKKRTGGKPTAWRLQPLADAQFIVFALAVLVVAAVDTGITFALYTYLPIAAELTTLETVLLLIPKTGMTLLVGIVLVSRRSLPWPPVWLARAGFVSLAAAAGGLALVADEAPGVVFLVAALVLAGAGVSLAGRGLFTIASGTTTSDRPAGSVFVSGSDLGAALGVAVFGAILLTVATFGIVGAAAQADLVTGSGADLEEIAADLEDELIHLTEPEAIELAAAIDAVEPVERVVRSSVVDALRVGFVAMAAVAIIGVALSIALVDRREVDA